MAKIDEIKELINTLRIYLTIISALIISIGAGISKLYISEKINILFWIGVVLCFIMIIVFIVIANALHKNIKKLKDL